MRQYTCVLHRCPKTKAGSALAFSALGFIGVLIPALALGQTIQDYVVDPKPPSIPLEKTIGYYITTDLPSVAIGSSSSDGGPGGAYLYISSGDLSGPWSQSVIDPSGDFYERMRPYQEPWEPFPGIVASRSGQLVWYINPNNFGGDPTQLWPMQVIADSWCHDIRVVDLDGDGLPDIVCSATTTHGTQSLIAYQVFNGNVGWQVINSPFVDPNGAVIGDSVNLISVNGSPRTNVLAATDNGVYWFQNPGANRTGPWVPHLINNGGSRNDIGETTLGVVPIGGSADAVVIASGEEPTGPWPNGLAIVSSADGRHWTPQRLDTTYRNTHEIDGGTELGPFFIVGEQEQVAPGCNSINLNEHPPSIPDCRLMLFQYQGGTFVPTLELSGLGAHNQQYVPYGSGIAVVGANHGGYGATDPALHIWFVSQ